MQGTVVILLALSGLGCHHKKCDTVPVSSCYSSCYSGSSCYSSGYGGSSCYSGGGCYSGSSCYSGGCYSGGYSSCYSSCYSGGSSCYSSCYSTPRHKHGLFGCKKKSCAACCAPVAVAPACDSCYEGAMPVYGTYTPVYEGYASSQSPSSQGTYMGPGASMQEPMRAPAPAPAVNPEPAPPTPAAPSPGNAAPATVPPVPAPVPAGI